MKEDRRVVVKFWLSFLYRQALSEVAAKLTRIDQRILNDLQRTRRLVDLAPPPPPLPSSANCISFSVFHHMCRQSRLSTGKRVGEEPSHTPCESLILYNSFSTLWYRWTWVLICKSFKEPRNRIHQPFLSYRHARAGIFEQSMRGLEPSRNRVIVPARQAT